MDKQKTPLAAKLAAFKICVQIRSQAADNLPKSRLVKLSYAPTARTSSA